MVFTKIYSQYKNRLFPKVDHIRGTTRLRKILFRLAHRELESYEGEPEGVMSKDWDNLIILDACRYDTYQKVFGDCEKRVSLGSHSAEFLQRNFGEGEFEDIVYINGNIHFTNPKMEEHIGKTDIFHEKFDTIMTKWDEEEGTVRPEKITEDALTAEKLFPEKRKIIHFIQPHTPFVDNPIEEKGDVYRLAELGKIPQEEVQKAYKKNTEILKEHVEKLAEELDGKTAVTADHGELMGEQGLYDHFRNSDAKGLREVPWEVLKKK